jgi:hypothetical protein
LDAAGVEFFEKQIRPVLVDHCYKCHSHEAEKVKGSLLLDTRDGVLKGGDTGPAIVPGDPEKSLLIKAIRYTDENLQMPPKGKKLSPAQVADFEAWVKMGAPDPRQAADGGKSRVEVIAAKARDHWAFKPIGSPSLPAVQNKRWPQSPVDDFILARLESRGLAPSPRADKRSLIRRATFDLIGVPPTPEEVSAFVADSSTNAFARLIDRLLASPQYGERWGRHWLDVARYADTKGYVFEEERRYPYSYTYRDYVIRSFNEDLPYDKFLVQQIAADQLGLDDKRSLAALGYLTLGRRFINNIHDIIDDRIDVVCRGMMGLTVACARCHDHKYDPIPAKDYYALYGVFASSMEPEVEPLLGVEDHSKAHDEYLAEHQKRVDTRAQFKRDKETETAARLRKQAGEYLLVTWKSRQATNQAAIDTLAREHKLDPGVLNRWKAGLESWGKTNHPVFTPWFAFAALPEAEFQERAKAITARLAAETGPGTNVFISRAFATNAPSSMTEVAERYGRVLDAVDQHWQEFKAQALKSASNAAAPLALPDPAEEALRQVLYAADAPANLPESEFGRLFDVPSSQKLRELQRKIDELDATHPGAPQRAMALVDRDQPHNAHLFIRGSPDNRGPEVPRQFVEILAGPNRKPFEKGSGRLELAQAIANRSNPLTARVLVNRVWLYHFGSPLVRTPGDFGLRSEPPSHPELLDYLATRFMNDGWSVKKLHRLMMLSSSYQQSSEDNPRSSRADPGNQLLWRMNRQRLDFEALRDSLLAISGKLDPAPGGHAVDITAEPFSSRRTVYGYIDRQNLPGLFRTFDFASPDATSPQRFYTSVPQQALFMMNSPFVVQQVKGLLQLAEFKASPSDARRVQFLYQRLFQRNPTPEEVRMAHDFCQAQLHLDPAEIHGTWEYGYGEFDESAKKLKAFTRLPHFTGAEFQGGPALPDPALGWVMLTEAGGHPGNDLKHAAVRRWIAPRDARLTISGTLTHDSAEGDGVRARIVSSEQGELGHWTVHHDKAETKVETVTVKKGERLDFITDCYQPVSFDSFGWTATLKVTDQPKAAGGKPESWNTKKDFADSARSQQKPLTPWEKYAQVLLLANELAFVD